MNDRMARIIALRRELWRLEEDGGCDHEPNPGPGPEQDTRPDNGILSPVMSDARLSAASELGRRARHLRQQADDLDALAAVLPMDLMKLSPNADRALWALATGNL